MRLRPSVPFVEVLDPSDSLDPGPGLKGHSSPRVFGWIRTVLGSSSGFLDQMFKRTFKMHHEVMKFDESSVGMLMSPEPFLKP